MLTFEEKEAIIQEFTELTRKEVSMKRVNYHYEKSLYEKTTVSLSSPSEWKWLCLCRRSSAI